MHFSFNHPVSGETELHALSFRYERPTFAYLLRCVRKAIIWLLSVVEDFDQVVFHDRNKVDLQIVWPTEGIFVRLSGGTVSNVRHF